MSYRVFVSAVTKELGAARAEGEPPFRCVQAICWRLRVATGHDHPNVDGSKANDVAALRALGRDDAFIVGELAAVSKVICFPFGLRRVWRRDFGGDFGDA